MSRPVRSLAVWCPHWPVVAAGVPAAEPAVVLHANRVVASSAAARAEGIGLGLRRRDAQRRCPQLTLVEPDPARDARAFEPVVAALTALTPRVEIVEPGRAALATRGPSRYFGGDTALAGRAGAVVHQVLAAGELDGECRVGIADGPFAAFLAARAEMVVPPGKTPAFLAPLPVAALERPDFADLLRRLGLRTLGDLAALPAGSVAARFGADGIVAHRLARGLDERPPATREPDPDLAVAMEIDPPAERLDQVAFCAKALADQLHQRLSGQGLACVRVAVEAETEHGERLCRLWRHEGVLGPAGIAERVRWQLDGWLSRRAEARPTGGLALLRLVPDQLVPDHGRQLGFWGGDLAAAERAARALARVQAMVGAEAVALPALVGGRSPAERVTLRPVWAGDLTGVASSSDGDQRARSPSEGMRPALRPGPWPGRIPAPAPARVPGDPLRAAVTDARGAQVGVSGRGEISAPPTWVSVAGAEAVEVVAWAGPWPADERWWDPPAHRRRARLQVITAGGMAHLLTLEAGEWWVEATYD